MTNEIRITISGPHGSGTSTIAEAVRRYLGRRFIVGLLDKDHELADFTDRHVENRLGGLADNRLGPGIVIETKQTKRDPDPRTEVVRALADNLEAIRREWDDDPTPVTAANSESVADTLVQVAEGANAAEPGTDRYLEMSWDSDTKPGVSHPIPLHRLTDRAHHEVNAKANSGWRVHTWTVSAYDSDRNLGRVDVLMEREPST